MWLNPDSNSACIAGLSVCHYLDSACAYGEIIWQSEDDLRKWQVRYGPHILCCEFVSLIITVD